MKQNYKAYLQSLESNRETVVAFWIEHTLANYLSDHPEDQTEVEHIIDYLVSEEAPSLTKMSYDAAKKNTDKWNAKLIKKGEHIKEVSSDTEVVLDFKDGFKIVKLIGKNAYEREGYLMRNCVASYFGRTTIVYSLRDKDNMPHMTAEHDRQVKGKGNGDIHPRYVGYVVKFLEHIGMTVGDSEMLHLGYINVEKFKDELSKDTKYFNDKYVPESEKLLDIEGKEFASLDLLDVKPLIKESIDSELKINFDLKAFLPLSIDFLFRHKKVKLENIESSDKNYAKLASSGDSAQLASSGDSAQLASSGDYAKLASSGDYAKLASSGDSAQLASSGYSAKLELNGKDSVGANISYKGKIKGKIGNWITLAEYDSNAKPLCVKSAQIDGKVLLEDTWYELKNGEFSEVK